MKISNMYDVFKLCNKIIFLICSHFGFSKRRSFEIEIHGKVSLPIRLDFVLISGND